MAGGRDDARGGTDPVVDADGLEKTYGDTSALSGVSLSVGRGEVFGLIGPNGAGKTTLVRALTGTTVPDAGSVTILGETPEAVDRNRIAVLPQAFSPPNRLTARELLTYYAGLYDDASDPDAVLADVGLADDGDTWYENLSGGQQRRVCVGAAIVNDPDLLFLDEPTTGIDPAGRRTVWNLLEALAAAGTTIVLTTHDMAEAERLTDRVGLLADGALVAQETPTTLVADHGGSSRLTIEADDGAGSTGGAGTAAIERALAEHALEYPVDSFEHGVVVNDIEPAEIGRVVDALEAADVHYTGLEWSEPGLEDVYLSLAGEVERAGTDKVVAAGGERR
ncbi:ABC transporter ATP-binding protein [Natronosalvus vescus]|uniref:ABC transporter ATP-binding protein n=1 Tax=Natronosalvus vescus TaxID=2953881 RepID=UPI002090FC56|nr:ABC transporter ATP-binding protein [Natronosalvus vescus]